jgi:hypothetical protein
LKAKSLTLLLSHYQTGRYQAIKHWHNGVHRLELHGMVPHIYHSQDLVAPPEYVAARPETELQLGGGECLSLYWSDGTPQDLEQDVRAVMDSNRKVGLLSGPGGQELTYRRRMHVVGARTRPGLGIFADMVPLAASTGVVVTSGEASDTQKLSAYETWHDSTYLPGVLTAELFSAVFDLKPMDEGEPNVFAKLYFTDAADPLAVFVAAQKIISPYSQAVGDFPGLDQVRRHIYSGVYQPVVDGADPYP